MTEVERLRAEIQEMYRRCPYCKYDERTCVPCKFHLGTEAVGFDQDENGHLRAVCPYCRKPE